MTEAIADSELPTHADEMICFALYSASHAIGRAYNPLLRKLRLTYPQYVALTVLWNEGEVTVGTLCARLRLNPNTVTPLLKRLELLGYVSRERGAEDERQVFVAATEKGQALKAHAPEITRCIIGATGKELEELKRLVTEISDLRDAVTGHVKEGP